MTSNLHPREGLEVTGWRPTARRSALTATAAVLVALMGFHFAMTALHAGPTSVLSVRAASLTAEYISPFFVQNWHLFAPNPINVDRGLLVRARVRDEAGTVTTTPYYDMTTPAMHHVHTNRLLHSKAPHMISTAISSLQHVDPTAAALRQRLAQQRQAQCSPPAGTQADETRPVDSDADLCAAPPPGLTRHEQAKRQEGLTLIRGLASAAAVQRWGAGVQEIQVRVVTHVFPPYSERHSPELGEVTHHDLDWMTVQEGMR